MFSLEYITTTLNVSIFNHLMYLGYFVWFVSRFGQLKLNHSFHTVIPVLIKLMVMIIFSLSVN